MGNITLSMTYLTLPHFTTLSHNRYDFVTGFLNIKCVFWFLYKFYPKYFKFSEEFSEILSQLYKPVHVQYRSFLSKFYETWILTIDFREIFKYVRDEELLVFAATVEGAVTFILRNMLDGKNSDWWRLWFKQVEFHCSQIFTVNGQFCVT